jgi:hypothetical protein
LSGNKESIGGDIPQAVFTEFTGLTADLNRKGRASRRVSWKIKRKNLKNRACQVAEASLGSTLFLGKPVRVGRSRCGRRRRRY